MRLNVAEGELSLLAEMTSPVIVLLYHRSVPVEAFSCKLKREIVAEGFAVLLGL